MRQEISSSKSLIWIENAVRVTNQTWAQSDGQKVTEIFIEYEEDGAIKQHSLQVVGG